MNPEISYLKDFESKRIGGGALVRYLVPLIRPGRN
jgi:hypothetical protein